MFTSRLTSFAIISTLVGSTVATFQILSPGGPDLWWGEYSSKISLSNLKCYVPKSPTLRTPSFGLAIPMLRLLHTHSCMYAFVQISFGKILTQIVFLLSAWPTPTPLF